MTESEQAAAVGRRGPAVIDSPVSTSPVSIEEGIADAFSQVLQEGRGGITADTDFFEAGGNSIMGAQLVAQLRLTLSVKVTIRDLFRARTASALAQVVRERAVQRPAVQRSGGRRSGSQEGSHAGSREAVGQARTVQLSDVPVLCLPHAGAGASYFRPWRELAPTGLTLVPVQLPGREELIDDLPFSDVAAAIRGLGPAVRTTAGPKGQVALFGHSFGAVLAFELARMLEAERPGTVARLFVSGAPGPWDGRGGRASGLDDDEFLERVHEFAGYRHPAFDLPELRDLLLPTLRADVSAHEEYRPLDERPITVPVTCLRGSDDDLVSAHEAAAWQRATTRPLDLVELPGGHMYLVDHAAELLALMADRLSAPTGPAGPAAPAAPAAESGAKARS